MLFPFRWPQHAGPGTKRSQAEPSATKPGTKPGTRPLYARIYSIWWDNGPSARGPPQDGKRSTATPEPSGTKPGTKPGTRPVYARICNTRWGQGPTWFTQHAGPGTKRNQARNQAPIRAYLQHLVGPGPLAHAARRPRNQAEPSGTKRNPAEPS
jgi:hypothetical protein